MLMDKRDGELLICKVDALNLTIFFLSGGWGRDTSLLPERLDRGGPCYPARWRAKLLTAFN